MESVHGARREVGRDVQDARGHLLSADPLWDSSQLSTAYNWRLCAKSGRSAVDC